MKVMSTGEYHQAVVHVEWAKAAIADDGTKAAVIQVSSFDPEKITGNFIPFDQLTEETVLSWVQQDYEKHKEMIEKSLLAQMDATRKANATMQANLPWIAANK